jgi:hypothetical protein
MKYSTHRILKTGHIELCEENEGKLHRSVIAPNESLEKYNDIIEADPNFEAYRTDENAEAYEAKLAENEPTEEERLIQWRQTAKLPSRKFWLGVELYPYGDGFMIDAINGAVKSLKGKQRKKVQIELDKTHEFNRNAPSTLMMIQAIGMTPEQADDFFRWADNEEWDNE